MWRLVTEPDKFIIVTTKYAGLCCALDDCEHVEDPIQVKICRLCNVNQGKYRESQQVFFQRLYTFLALNCRKIFLSQGFSQIYGCMPFNHRELINICISIHAKACEILIWRN